MKQNSISLQSLQLLMMIADSNSQYFPCCTVLITGIGLHKDSVFCCTLYILLDLQVMFVCSMKGEKLSNLLDKVGIHTYTKEAVYFPGRETWSIFFCKTPIVLYTLYNVKYGLNLPSRNHNPHNLDPNNHHQTDQYGSIRLVSCLYVLQV